MEKESEKKTHSNTAYIPTKCRVTKPPPPKPATNPLQFVKVNPNPLFKHAAEKVKKIEEVKVTRQENVRDEAEDWQSNLDNWKSSRRKRQEHIIERVEEVKKLGQEGTEKCRRKGTTFNEILEKRNKGSRPKFSIPLYDNDSNDLSDYGIGSSSSKTNSIKDVDTDDNSSILDEKDNSYEETTSCHMSQLGKDAEDKAEAEANSTSKYEQIDNNQETISTDKSMNSQTVNNNEQYTYEGAIQDYRSRIRTKINVNEVSFEKLESSSSSSSTKSKEYAEAQTLLPKGNLFERMKMFQSNNANDNVPSRQVCEDLMNAQSIKERLQTLEKCTEQSTVSSSVKSDAFVGSLKIKLNQFNDATSDPDAKNNNPTTDSFKESADLVSNNPGYDTYMEKLSKSANLDALYIKTDVELNGYRPSTSSSDLVTVSSDREDSGIHTTDVSCSVSQSDEPVEDTDISVPHECQNYRAFTQNFLSTEQEFASKTNNWVHESAAVKNVKNVQTSVSAVELSHLEDLQGFYGKETTPLELLISPVHPKLKPPSEKPPPPPVTDHLNSTTRIKKELQHKRSSFLGLEEQPRDSYFDHFEKNLVHGSTVILDTKKSLKTLPENKTPEKIQNSVVATSREEEIMKKEREIIELIEKEEKFKEFDHENKQKQAVVHKISTSSGSTNTLSSGNNQSTDIYLGNKKFDEPYYPEPCFNDLDEQDSEVLKVEHELLQLEKEELKRQRENLLFHEKSAKLNKNCHSYDNMYYSDYHKNLDYRKSMPELQNLPTTTTTTTTNDYRQTQVFQSRYGNERLKYQKSMPNIQQSYNKRADYISAPKYDLGIPFDHRKSMPDLDHVPKSAFISTSANNNLLMPIKPFKSIDKIDRQVSQIPFDSDIGYRQSNRHQPLLRHSNARPSSGRSKSMPKEAWIQPKANSPAKSYNQHWLYQEAELRRLSEQSNKNASIHNRMLLNEKKVDSNPQLTYLVDNKSPKRSVPLEMQQKDYVNLPFKGREQTYGHALPMSYPPHLVADDGHNVILSVSGKKKCSYCGKELGRGAAMIIESLSLFYHMECFKCCVCHMELGDGLMGTDVRVRNQKLHCHNCYSSDDGIKFSCV